MKRFRIVCIAAIALVASFAFFVRTFAAEKQEVMIPMKDGIKLSTDVYLPGDGTGKYPTILARGPYGKGLGALVAMQVNAKGYACVVQDVRGKHGSEGHHAIIFGNEGLGKHQDAHDTLNWITAQPWSNGNVGMWGGSAYACTQNMAAPGAPSSLKGMAVVSAFSSFYHQTAYQGGVWRKSMMEGWLAGNNIVDVNQETFLNHPYYDEFWKELDPELHASKVNSPGVYSGGWYDIFLQGTINSFVTIQNNGGPGAKGKNFLVLAPIGHGNFSDLKYPASAGKLPINGIAPFELWDHWLKEPNPEIAKLKPVHYYVMGDPEDPKAPGNFWRAADTWPPDSTITPYYMHIDGSLGTTAPTSNDSMPYQYDPKNPVPTHGGANLLLPLGPKDQRHLEERGDVLVFTTPVLDKPVEVTGRIYAKLYVSSDCPDTDFTVKLTDVYPDGRSMLVLDGIRRASLRNTYEKPEFLEKGKVYEVEVDLWSTSLIFNKGHRIRVAVSSSNAPRFEPNPNTGDPHPKGEFRVATNTIHLSKEHPSSILLPIYGEQVR